MFIVLYHIIFTFTHKILFSFLIFTETLSDHLNWHWVSTGGQQWLSFDSSTWLVFVWCGRSTAILGMLKCNAERTINQDHWKLQYFRHSSKYHYQIWRLTNFRFNIFGFMETALTVVSWYGLICHFFTVSLYVEIAKYYICIEFHLRIYKMPKKPIFWYGAFLSFPPSFLHNGM